MGGRISRAFGEDHSGNYNLPADYQTPSFPSLYTPRWQAIKTGEGIYLYSAEDVWAFTIQWMIIFMVVIYFVCSAFATLTLFISMSRARLPLHSHATAHDDEIHPPKSRPTPDTPIRMNQLRPRPTEGLTPITPVSPISPSARSDAPLMKRLFRSKRRRPPIWPIVLIPIVVTGMGIMLAVVVGTVVGFALATIYSTGRFLMSTWIPFLWSLVMSLILVLGSYSTLTAIL